MIAEAIARIRREHDIPVVPSRRGPVSLNQFFEEIPGLSHVAIGQLNCGRVTEYLLANGITVDSVGEPDEKLAGFIFATRSRALAFVDANDNLQRRRFTAAHELGHAVLHRNIMGSYLADTDKTLLETDEAITQMEREANRFAAELLMPEEIIHARVAEMKKAHGACPRGVLEYRLSAELLVSRQAMGYRLKALEVGE